MTQTRTPECCLVRGSLAGACWLGAHRPGGGSWRALWRGDLCELAQLVLEGLLHLVHLFEREVNLLQKNDGDI